MIPRRAAVVRLSGDPTLMIPGARIDLVSLAIDRMAVLPQADACLAPPRHLCPFFTPASPRSTGRRSSLVTVSGTIYGF
jgi:hypothetical protein